MYILLNSVFYNNTSLPTDKKKEAGEHTKVIFTHYMVDKHEPFSTEDEQMTMNIR